EGSLGAPHVRCLARAIPARRSVGLRVKLVLIRHGDAGDPDPGRYPDDRLRPLTPKGEHEHRVVGQILAGMGLGFTHLLTSPLRRAHQTAEITARTLGWTEAIESVDALGENFSVSALLEKLGDFPDRAVVACVGHEPHLSRFPAALCYTPTIGRGRMLQKLLEFRIPGARRARGGKGTEWNTRRPRRPTSSPAPCPRAPFPMSTSSLSSRPRRRTCTSTSRRSSPTSEGSR